MEEHYYKKKTHALIHPKKDNKPRCRIGETKEAVENRYLKLSRRIGF
jgi:hypothetical protein